MTNTPVESWEEWVRVLANSTNQRDVDLLIAKIDVLLAQQREEIVGRVEEMKTSKKYKAMVENGDLSFLNYTPTGIYVKGLEDAIKIIKGE